MDEWYAIEERGYATPCWIWLRAQDGRGYGVRRIRGVLQKAHRIFYEQRHGAIPKGLDIDHLCRNRACVNPDHLEVVARAENLRRGSGTKLTSEQVSDIRRMAGVVSQRELERRYGLSRGHVSRIINGRQSDGRALWEGVV